MISKAAEEIFSAQFYLKNAALSRRYAELQSFFFSCLVVSKDSLDLIHKLFSGFALQSFLNNVVCHQSDIKTFSDLQ